MRSILNEKPCPAGLVFSLKLDNLRYHSPGEQSINFAQFSKEKYLYYEQIMIYVPRGLRKDFDRIVKKNEKALGFFTLRDEQSLELKSSQFEY